MAAASPIQLLALGFAVGGFETDAQRAAFENMPPLGTTGRRGGDSLRAEQRKLQSIDSILAASLRANSGQDPAQAAPLLMRVVDG